MIKSVIITLLMAVSAWSQTAYDYVATSGNVSLSSQTYAVTLQQPAATSNPLPVQFPAVPGVGASVYCSAACVVSVIVNTGSSGAATATAGTVNAVLPNSPQAIVKFYTASNYSGGTTLWIINVPAGVPYPLDMSPTKLGGPLSNITFAVASVTATVNITLFPQEIH